MAPYIEDIVINIRRQITLPSSSIITFRNLPKATYNPFIGGRLAYEYYKSFRYIKQNLHYINSPVLLLKSQKDSLNTIEEAERFIKKIGSYDKTLEIIDSNIHRNVSNASQSDLIRSIVLQWMVKRATTASTLGESSNNILDSLKSNINLKRLRKRNIFILITTYLSIMI